MNEQNTVFPMSIAKVSFANPNTQNYHGQQM